MAITQAIANTFKKQLLEGDMEFQFGGDKFKLALYTSSAVLNSATTSFTSTAQVPNSGTYASGGGALVQPNPSTSVASVLRLLILMIYHSPVQQSLQRALIYILLQLHKCSCAV